ncbi:MAG: hypothetical protein IPJ65_00220 [Archangiaceae bacterium]|nr:hypothetical protein [Archangiaceae bacterium]
MRRGQTLALLALTMLLIVVMAFMTISITMRVRQKLELQTVVDVAAYNDAVSTARAMNEMGLINRTIVSHWVVMLGIQANMAFGSMVPAYFDAFADSLNKMRFASPGHGSPVCGSGGAEARRQQELTEARNMFMHASFALWSGRNNTDLDLSFCKDCFHHLNPGLGQLDQRVARESEDVRSAVRDLVEVQRDLKTQLEKHLHDRDGTRAVAAAALGTPTSPDIFPYAIKKGAPLLPPGWREVNGALASTRNALTPMAHAAMGSRGSRFVMSGSFLSGGEHYRKYRPYRVIATLRMIQRVMNNRWPAERFTFRFTQGLLATWMERGSAAAELDGDTNPDDNGYLDELDQISGPDVPTEEDENDPPADDPKPYDPALAWRMTPAREIGVEYASGKQNASIYITYRGPCGVQERSVNIFAYARVHANNGSRFPESQHEWVEGTKSRGTEPGDGARNYFINGDKVLHGVLKNDEGYEVASHNIGFLCHPWHRHPAELNDIEHAPGEEIDDLGVMPGGFGFLFPQNGPDPDTGIDRDGASGAFGQPKTPVLMTRANSGGGMTRDPWNLDIGFKFSSSGSGAEVDFLKAGDQPMVALGTGMAYYHRRCDNWQSDRGLNRRPPLGRPFPAGCVSWQEPPNLLNPFWHATLVPIDIDEDSVGPRSAANGDATPGNRRINEARRMLQSSSLDTAAAALRKLRLKGFQGIQ